VRRIIGKFFTAFVMSLMSAPVLAQSTYPDRPVRIIVTFAPGSDDGNTSRMMIKNQIFKFCENAAPRRQPEIRIRFGCGGSD
jgi:hypothetical protein